MNCVNTKSKEFKDTCSRLNIAKEHLEIIVHEYQNTEGNDNSFPSDSYIMERLTGVPTKTKSSNVVKLWEKQYSKPTVFNSYKEAINFKNSATKFFDSDSIYLYKNNDGKYTINVARPIFDNSKELESILKNALRNSEGELLAPNSKVSKFTEKQTVNYLEAFKVQNDTLRDQFNNLEQYGLTDEELKEIAEDFVVLISDTITEYQSNPKKILEDFPELNSVDRTQENKTEALIEDIALQFEVLSRTREGVVRLIGVERLVNKVRQQLFSGVDMTLGMRRLGRNYNALLATAYAKFQELEEFAIIGESGMQVHEVSNEDVNNVNKESDTEEIRETYGDSQEHWQVETRTLDVLDNATAIVKRALSTCIQYDSKGNPKKSRTGRAKRVNAKDATAAILRWTRGSLDIKDMISHIEAKVNQGEVWAAPILKRLQDTSGKEYEFQSQFFKVFAKHFHTACVVVKEKGKYVVKTVNENPALREAKNSIISLYNIGNHPLFLTDGSVNKKSFNRLKVISEELKGEGIDVIELITEAVNLLGYYISEEHTEKALQIENALNTIKENLGAIVKNIDFGKDNKTYSPFEYGAKNSIEGYLSKLLTPIVEQFEDTAISSYYDNGKMYQSYITPSYMTKLILKFGGQDSNKVNEFIDSEYKKYEWFYKNGEWRNDWLDKFTRVTPAERKKLLKHKTQLHFDKNYYMKGMTEQQYILSVITEYFNGGDMNIAWYKMPLQSNKPASEFISFFKYTDANSSLSGGYQTVITSKLYDVFLQEFERIKQVRKDNLSKSDSNDIKNYHEERGKHFVFLDFFNAHLDDGNKSNSELGKLINKSLQSSLTVEESTKFTELTKEAINYYIGNIVESTITQWKNQGILQKVKDSIISENTLKKYENESQKLAFTENLLREFLWNDTFASTQLLQLTITDPAYYKDTEDLQKRLAQLHSPGVRGNKYATDNKGKEVTDGFFRTLVLKDVKLNSNTLKSNILENVEIALDKRIEEAAEGDKQSLKVFKDMILKQFRDDINIADAQSFSSPTSYRKKALVFGIWNEEKEEIYQKIKEGKASFSDIKEAMQPLKPFTYTQISKEINGKTIKVPIQHKTAEYLLVMADAIIGDTNTGKPNLLRAIFDFMEQSAKEDSTKGIDTILFESSVKSGLHGAIEVASLNDAVDGEARLLEKLNESKDNMDVIPVEDYALQQEVPLHYYEHSQAHGSQIRALLPSDLPPDATIDGKNVKEFRREYEETIAANIEESLNLLAEEFGLNEEHSRTDRNYLLSKVLQREILSNSRYGIDLLKAVMINEDGEFTLPLQDPIHSKRIEQLINSIIKNRVNKQTLPGGPVVQVSNFGMSKRLNIRFKDAEGNLIETRDKFTNEEEYKDYLNKNQDSIAYFECIAPASTKELLRDFIDHNGFLDVETLEAINPDLLKAVGYRIPTEGKHSMQPLKIVGFAPREAGEVLILPYEITLISGSDKPRHCFYQYNIKNCVNCWEALTLSRG